MNRCKEMGGCNIDATFLASSMIDNWVWFGWSRATSCIAEARQSK